MFRLDNEILFALPVLPELKLAANETHDEKPGRVDWEVACRRKAAQ